MVRRILLVVVMVLGWGAGARAADCAAPVGQAKSEEPAVDWYDNYMLPYRTLPASAATARLNKQQVESFIEDIRPFHRSAVLDPLYFEALVQQLTAGYTSLAGFHGIDTMAAEKIYKAGTGHRLEFSLMCIHARSVRGRDDAFGITLFGVPTDDCQHVGLRGLVFTETLINGSANGKCRPDLTLYKMYIFPYLAGTNEITFVCRKEQGACAR